MMSSTGDRRTILEAIRKVWALGGVRAYYRGLGVSVNYYSLPYTTLTHTPCSV